MKLGADDRAFLDGLLSFYDELPDGAWQGACEDAIRECDRFKGRDPSEVWLAWCESIANDDEQEHR